MINQIYLRRRNKVVDLTKGRKATKQQIATLNANLHVLGYSLEPKLAASLRQTGLAELAKELIQTLQAMKGVKNYSPVYPNFPDQVMEASEAELYWNAITQYFHDFVADVTGDRSFVWAPSYDKKDRGELKDRIKLTVIRLGTEDDLKSILTSLMASNTSVSQQDKEDVTWFLEWYGFDSLPKAIPHKEMLGLVGSLAIKKDVLHKLWSRFKTATDILRLATAMSDGDVSLAENTKFKNFTRPQRRGLLTMLNRCNEPTEDMLRQKERWLRLGERLHPGEYVKTLPVAAESFSILRDGKPFQSFASKVELSIKNEDIKGAVALLKTRPGSFARRLDQLLRVGTRYDQIVAPFLSVAEDVSTPVLLQVRSHFEERAGAAPDLRIFFPKGAVAKVQAIKNELPPMKSIACEKLIAGIEDVLIKRFAKLPSLGRCRIDEVLREVVVPFSQRSASKALRTITRGSRLPFGTGGDTVRFFIWWKEKEGDRTDVDLSATYFNENWQLAGRVAYYNLREGTTSCHSGDRTSAPQGACEFIDLNIPACLKMGRYVVMNVNSFTRQKFSDMPECFAGWMIRQHPGSGEIFDPKTVKDRLDVGSDSTQTIPMILDLQERKVIWTDVNLKANPRRANNVHHNLSNIALFGKAFTEMKKPNLYDLIALHVRARGILVEEGPAKKVFGIEDALGIERVMSEFLA